MHTYELTCVYIYGSCKKLTHIHHVRGTCTVPYTFLKCRLPGFNHDHLQESLITLGNIGCTALMLHKRPNPQPLSFSALWCYTRDRHWCNTRDQHWCYTRDQHWCYTIDQHWWYTRDQHWWYTRDQHWWYTRDQHWWYTTDQHWCYTRDRHWCYTRDQHWCYTRDQTHSHSVSGHFVPLYWLSTRPHSLVPNVHCAHKHQETNSHSVLAHFVL
jgi:hypothetical protein